MNGVQTRFKCKLDVKRCKRFVFPPSSLLPRSNALKTKAIRYFQTDRTLTRIVSPPLSETQNHFGRGILHSPSSLASIVAFLQSHSHNKDIFSSYCLLSFVYIRSEAFRVVIALSDQLILLHVRGIESSIFVDCFLF